MKQPLRKLSVLLTSAALTATLAGCSPADVARLERLCRELDISDCQSLLPGGGRPTNPQQPDKVTATPIAEEKAPADLVSWAESMRAQGTSGSKVVTVGHHTYVGIAGGLQPSGGYRVQVDKVEKRNGVWTVRARVVPPPFGRSVSTALENPIGFFRLPKLTGEVKVEVAPAPASEVKAEPVSLSEAPAELKAWAEAQRQAEPSGSKTVTKGDYTYVAIAGGMQPSGGYRVEAEKAVRTGDGWLLQAKVVAPSPDQVVSAAMENPVGVFRLPKLAGELRVEVTPPPAAEIKAVPIELANAPAELRSWWESHRLARESGSRVITEGNHTYVAISGGMQPTGGYRVEVDKVVRKDGGWVIEAKVVPPAPGEFVTLAFTHPVIFVQLPKLSGDIEVKVAGANVPAENRLTVAAAWARKDRVQVTGTAAVGDLHFEVKVGDSVLAQADAQVKEGEYSANLLVPGGSREGMTLVVSDPAGGEILATVQLDGEGDVFSQNFQVFRPRLIARDRIRLEGKVRAFEGAFKVEVWSGDRMLAEQWLQASEGAPAFGSFSGEIEVKGGVPAGAEVRYILESARDGSQTVELTLPVERSR